jgi:hypothetical protein
VVRAMPVTRVTAKRIYFRGGDDGPKWIREREFFIPRGDVEQAGEIWHQTLHERLYLKPPEPRDNQRSKSVAELRREMAECHPDVGGDPAEFRAAHGRYVAARAVADV